MSRIALGFLLFAFTAFLAIQADPAPLAAQVGEKKKKNDKDKANPPMGDEKEDESRVVFAFDPGSHTRPISALGFNKDQTKLITVGWDYSIQIWSASTGERLDILRLPPYGRDNGFDSNRWNQAAISADGAFVAIGGGPKLLHDDKGIPTRLLIVDVANRRVRKIIFPADPKSPVTCLSFSANGNRLAVGFGGTDKSVYILDDVIQSLKNAPAAKLPFEPALVIKEMTQQPHYLALSPTGNKLVIEENTASIMSFDVAGRAVEKWKKLGEFKEAGQNELLEWAPDESHFARSWRTGEGSERNGIQLRSSECKLLKNWTFGELAPGFGRAAITGTFRYIDAERLFITADASLSPADRGRVGVILNPKTGKSARHFSESISGKHTPVGAASTGGALAAITSQQGLEAVIFNITNGKVVARCGSRTPIPTIVGWSKDAKFPAIAWSDDATLKPFKSKLDDLKYAFDLVKLEPVAEVAIANFTLRLLELGEWKLIWGTGVHKNSASLMQGSNEVFKWALNEALTLIPTGADRPLFARAVHDQLNGMGSYASIYDCKGKKVVELLPIAAQHRDLVSSPDGRYVLTSTGTHRLCIYRTDGSRFPFLNIVQANGEWVCWTSEGYYAASPGGEKLIGWAESNGANSLVTFHSADKFAKQFRRPDIIKLAIEKGSMAEALKELKTKPAEIEEILPPKAELKLVKQNGALAKVKASAASGVKDKPVLSMQLLLDGRPLSEGRGVLKVDAGKLAETEWEVAVPGGPHELRMLARSDDGAAISDPLPVIGPKNPGEQPTIHRLCVGINDYDDPGLKLSASTKDATDVFAALEKYCVGSFNRYGAAKGQLIVDKAATREAVINALSLIRKAAKPGHLVVFYFAGHGVKQENEYYLLTRDADTSKSLKNISLSGDDLRKALGDMECPVLFIMDACHSAKGAKAFRPATDDLTRSLTDDSAGVTVMAAAMAHEVAMASSENGYFTAALLKALEAGEGVPFDPYERALYTHHIYSVVFSEVRKATHGKQNPFLNSPWTVPPLAVREIAKP